MNTAASTSEMAMIGLVIWSMALRVASRGERCSSRMMSFDGFDDHDGVVDHDADGQHHAKQRELVDGEAEDLPCR